MIYFLITAFVIAVLAGIWLICTIFWGSDIYVIKILRNGKKLEIYYDPEKNNEYHIRGGYRWVITPKNIDNYFENMFKSKPFWP